MVTGCGMSIKTDTERYSRAPRHRPCGPGWVTCTGNYSTHKEEKTADGCPGSSLRTPGLSQGLAAGSLWRPYKPTSHHCRMRQGVTCMPDASEAADSQRPHMADSGYSF